MSNTYKRLGKSTASYPYSLEDHICRCCGGRVVRQLAGSGPTGGGNPVYSCSLCGKGAASMGPDVVCWCGYRHRGQGSFGYLCVPTRTVKDLRDAGEADQADELEREFRGCGIDPTTTLIGIVTDGGYQRVLSKKKSAPDTTTPT